MDVLVTCKYEEDPIKNEGARVDTTLYSNFSDAQGQITLVLVSVSGLDLMFMKHYAPNRCLYIKVAKLRTGVGSAKTSYLQNCSVKLFKEHFKVQIFKSHHPLSANQV